MDCDLRSIILDAIRSNAEGDIDKAKANIEVYLHNPVGIGEHPDVLAAIQEQLDIIAHSEERIAAIEQHFSSSTAAEAAVEELLVELSEESEATSED